MFYTKGAGPAALQARVSRDGDVTALQARVRCLPRSGTSTRTNSKRSFTEECTRSLLDDAKRHGELAPSIDRVAPGSRRHEPPRALDMCNGSLIESLKATAVREFHFRGLAIAHHMHQQYDAALFTQALRGRRIRGHHVGAILIYVRRDNLRRRSYRRRGRWRRCGQSDGLA